jgi:murein L,D-transpeptidase YcbB/YkuD
MKRFLRLLPCVLVLVASIEAAPAEAARKPKAQAPVPDASGAVRELLRAGKHPDLAIATFADVKAEVDRAYAATDGQPLWFDGGRPSAAARGLVARLAGADSLGLDPGHYDARWLAVTVEGLSMKRAQPTAEDRARFDVGLSVAAARFLSALDVGRVAPKIAQEDTHLPAPDPTEGVTLEALRDPETQARTIRRAEPVFRHYQLLKNALVRYRKLALDPTLNASLGIPRDTKPDAPLANAARLRKLLEATGDLGKHKRPKAKNDRTYSPELVEAVKKFQRRHGQLPDGILFVQTIQELERPFTERVRQIERSLERWRWLPGTYDAPPIVVNVAAFRLHAYRGLGDGPDDALDMEVLVGAAQKSQTPLFTADLKYVVFRPWWDLPASIQTFELGPRAQWDWENMQKLGYVLVGANGSTTELTPENVDRIGKGADMRQKPGEMNALGLVKFMLPNPHDIYLHDTPARGLFAFPRRDLSHGCVRVAEPAKLAEHVLGGSWTAEQVAQAMEGEDDHRVDLEKPIPVYFTYATAVAAPDGEISFFDDVYGLDKELGAILEAGPPWPTTRASAQKRTPGQGRISTEVPTGTTR